MDNTRMKPIIQRLGQIIGILKMDEAKINPESLKRWLVYYFKTKPDHSPLNIQLYLGSTTRETLLSVVLAMATTRMFNNLVFLQMNLHFNGREKVQWCSVC